MAGAALPPPAPSPADPAAAHLLMTAAESCLALSMAAHDGSDSEGEGYASKADQLAAFMAAPPGRFGEGGASAGALRGLPKPAVAGVKRPRLPRSVRCGKCDGCERDDCGMCKNCVDKPRFGGPGARKQGCIRKICRDPRPAP